MTGYNPYSKGRWYRFFIESDGVDVTLTESDLDGADIGSSRLKMPNKFHIVDAKYDFHSEVGGSNTFNHTTYFSSDGAQGVSVPNANAFDYGYVHIFGYFEE